MLIAVFIYDKMDIRILPRTHKRRQNHTEKTACSETNEDIDCMYTRTWQQEK